MFLFLFFKKNIPVKRTYTVTIFGRRNSRQNIGEKIDYILLLTKAKFRDLSTIRVGNLQWMSEQKQIIFYFLLIITSKCRRLMHSSI